jgi:hypothetical protein
MGIKPYGRRLALLLAILLIPELLGCDPQKEAIKFLLSQGLIPLQPARDYVVPGGMLIQSDMDRVVYMDPLAEGIAATPSLIKIDTSGLPDHHQATTLDLALGLIAQEIKIPPGLHISGAQEVNLANLDISGSRLTAQEVSNYVKREEVDKFVRRQLLHSRVFIVQEVYLFNGLVLTSATGGPLEVSNSSRGGVPSCKVQNGTDISPQEAAPPEVATEHAGARSVAADEAGTKLERSSPESRGYGGTDVVSVSICRSSASELAVVSDRPVAFAVRPCEVTIGVDESLVVHYAVAEKLSRNLAGSILRGVR